MKISSLIDSKNHSKYRDVLNKDLEEYVAWFRENKPNNRPFKDLYNDVLEALKNSKVEIKDEEKAPEPINPTLEKLNKISLQEIQYYVRDAKYNTMKNHLPTLGALYTFEPNLNDKKRPRWQDDAIKYQEILKAKCETIIDNYYNFDEIKSLPATIDKDLSFAENLRKAALEFLDFIDLKSGCTKYDFGKYKGQRLLVLQKYYRDNKTIKEIAAEQKNQRSAEVLASNYIHDFLKDLMESTKDGIKEDSEEDTKLCKNLCIHDDLKQWIESIKELCVFNSKSFMEKLFGGPKDKDDIGPLGLEFVNVVGDVQFVIPSRKKGTYEDLSKSIINELRNTIVPSTPSAIFEKIISSEKCQKIKDDFNEVFINNVLSCPEIVDIMDNGLIRIKEELQTKEQKAARLMLELSQKNGTATMQQLSDAFQEKYNTPYKNLSTLKRFGFNPVQERGTHWHYGSSLMPLLDAVREYVEENKIFYYDDIISYLEEKGYVITESVRLYLTNMCNVDTKDNQHFCHRDYCDDYPKFTWRAQAQTGLSNWILNQVNYLLGFENEMEFDKILYYIVQQAQGTIYAKNIKNKAVNTIKSYCGEKKPFIFDGYILRKNFGFYENTDFETIGLRGGKYPFFKHIRAFIANYIKKCEDGKLLLTEAIKMIDLDIEEHKKRDVIIKAIENKHLPSIGVELSTIDGKRYIIKSSDFANIHKDYEPVYKIHASCKEQDKSVVVEEQDVQDRNTISNRMTLDWNLLHEDLLRELSNYSSLMKSDNIDLDKAIGTFLEFIRSSKNPNLSSILTQHLFEFCRAKYDRFDTDTYVRDLAIFYEGLLLDILRRNQGKQGIKGLRELAVEFPVLAHALSIPQQRARGFEGIFKDLHSKRNILVHGDYLELNSFDKAKCILDFTALYIYTVAKYVQ